MLISACNLFPAWPADEGPGSKTGYCSALFPGHKRRQKCANGRKQSIFLLPALPGSEPGHYPTLELLLHKDLLHKLFTSPLVFLDSMVG